MLRPPGVKQSAWDRNVEQTHISDSLGTVHDLGLIIFNETRSTSDGPNSNESLDDARQKAAHTVINADEMWGADRMRNASSALPIEPPANALSNPDMKSAYDASMKAAREAFLSGSDPTNGAVYFNLRTNAGRGNRIMSKYDKKGVRLSTQSGPYNNSYTKGDTPSRTVWIDTYYPQDK